MVPLGYSVSLRQTPNGRSVVWLPRSIRVWRGIGPLKHDIRVLRIEVTVHRVVLVLSVHGVSVREMAEENIFMMSFLEANWPLSVGINGNCSVW